MSPHGDDPRDGLDTWSLTLFFMVVLLVIMISHLH